MLGGNGLNYEYEMERDFRKYRFIGLFWIGISMLFLEGCANIGKPDGGMKDWDAPVYLYSTPKMDQTNFHKDKLEITFDEIVGIDNSNDKIVVSPPQKKKLNVKSYGKKLVVRLRDTLKENTTYTIDFSDAVKDNNEGNRLQNFYLSFATGDTLDSMQFQGRLLSAYNLEPITGCYVGITSNLTDTAFTKTPLERLSYTDSEGKFVTEIEISLDTTRSTIVERAADLLGRSFIVNDISAGEEDSRMLETVATLKLGYIAMHKRGTPKTMMDLCHYNDVVKEVQDYFIDFQSRCPFQSWIMDPGFGFAKDLKQNYELLSKLGLLRMEGHPLLVGISRKSFIYKALNITTEEALCPTQALHMAALERGADILRVHDVKEARETLELYRRLNA